MRILVSALLAATAALAAPAQAQDWPGARQVTIIVPFSAGGTTDMFGRIFANAMQQKYGQPFVVENRAGAGGTIGAAAVAKAANDGYPPYNIERLPRTEHEPERLRITLAVAGFTRDQLDVMLEENQLVIRGRQADDKTRHFLHRGIAARQFQRAFLLADGMEVLGADLSNGLLSIDLARPEPERIIRKIDIAQKDES